MAVVLLDTGVASFLHPKRQNSPQRRLYEPDLQGQTLGLSFQSIAELFLWAEQNRWGTAQRHALDLFVRRFALIPYDEELGRAWARIMAYARAGGRRLESADAWIAASALRHRIPLVTHDKDFLDLQIPDLSVICHAI